MLLYFEGVPDEAVTATKGHVTPQEAPVPASTPGKRVPLIGRTWSMNQKRIIQDPGEE